MFALKKSLFIFYLAPHITVNAFTMNYSPKLKGNLPKILPPQIQSNVPGSWQYDTMTRRIVDDILARIIEDNKDELTRPTSSLRSECLLLLNDLKSSVLSQHTGYLRGVFDGGPDISTWDSILSQIPDGQRNWLDAPWIISEFYFYRRIVEAFKFFETGYDMFIPQKAAGLQSSIPLVDELSKRLPLLLQSKGKTDVSIAIKTLVLTSLWGNKADLSLWPAPNKQAATSARATNEVDLFADMYQYLLDNQIDDVSSLLDELHENKYQTKDRVVSIVVDNAGYELVTDLILGYGLVKLNVVDQVIYHTKGHPTFVSDALTADCFDTINYLNSEPSESIRNIAADLITMADSNKLCFESDLFWCQPTPMWDMPDSGAILIYLKCSQSLKPFYIIDTRFRFVVAMDVVVEKLSSSSLVFVKGDANYRRLLGERQWPLDTPAKSVLSYWPVPVCALRTFKAEVGCGITGPLQEFAELKDPNWLVSGKWGVIQVGGQGSEGPA